MFPFSARIYRKSPEGTQNKQPHINMKKLFLALMLILAVASCKHTASGPAQNLNGDTTSIVIAIDTLAVDSVTK